LKSSLKALAPGLEPDAGLSFNILLKSPGDMQTGHL